VTYRSDAVTSVFGIAGIGIFAPPQVVNADQLADETGVPAEILRTKFGVQQVHRADAGCHVSEMAALAGRAALHDAGVAPEEVDLVVYCGSEFKDYVVWSAAAKIAHVLGCTHAEAYEIYALCAGMPITLRVVRDMMLAEEDIRTVLVVAASKESALVDRTNQRTRFMFNFGDGASAAVVRRGLNRNLLLGSGSKVDGSLSEDAIIPAGGSRRPATAETVAAGEHTLDVPNLDHMRSRLDEVSSFNFREVVQMALRRSGLDRIDFLAPVHMKRSMHDQLQRDLGATHAFYLEEYGHMQAADQFTAVWEARQRGLLKDGDVVALVAAGVGYTWSATILRWGVTQVPGSRER